MVVFEPPNYWEKKDEWEYMDMHTWTKGTTAAMVELCEDSKIDNVTKIWFKLEVIIKGKIMQEEDEVA